MVEDAPKCESMIGITDYTWEHSFVKLINM